MSAVAGGVILFLGWSPLIELVDGNASIAPSAHELPLFTMEAPEVPQRNYLPHTWPAEGDPTWTVSKVSWRNGRFSEPSARELPASLSE